MKFIINESENLQYYFVLKANNNEVVAVSETYTTKEMCKKGIRAVKKCYFAEVVDLT